VKIARRSLRHLVASWVGYWAVLAAVTLTPAAIALWRVSRNGAKGDASVALGDAGLRATISLGGVTQWDHTVSLATFVLYVAGPPLLLWVGWLLSTSREGSAEENEQPQQLTRGDELPLRKTERSKDAIE
jgi:threonine/homoserine/homoserine lactone efflux protein